MKDHADGDVVDPRLVPQDQLFERGTVAVPGLFHQFSIRNAALGHLAEGIEHESPPCSNDIGMSVWTSPGDLDTGDGAAVTARPRESGNRFAGRFHAMSIATCMY